MVPNFLQCLEGSCKKLRRIWVDGGYRGARLGWVSEQFRFVCGNYAQCRAKGVSCTAPSVGCGKNLRMAQPQIVP